jgi:hypothetical protein
MEVFEGWNGAIQVLQTARGLVLQVCFSLAGIAFAVFVTIEIWKYLVGGDKSVLQFHQFFRTGLVLLLLFNYTEIAEMIGNALYAFSWDIRSADPALGQAQDEPFGEFVIIYATAYEMQKAAADMPEGSTVWDLLQANFFEGMAAIFEDFLASILISGAGLLIVLARFIMVGIKNIAYFFLMACGPIPIVLSIIPGLGTYTAHWLKGFITVGMWGVTIAVLDLVYAQSIYFFFVDTFTKGDDEFTYAFITWMLLVAYLLVPYLTSLLIGQAAVQSFGQKVFGVVLTAATLGAAGAKIFGEKAAGSTAASSGTGAKAAAGSAPAAAAAQPSYHQHVYHMYGSSASQGPRSAYATGSEGLRIGSNGSQHGRSSQARETGLAAGSGSSGSGWNSSSGLRTGSASRKRQFTPNQAAGNTVYAPSAHQSRQQKLLPPSE